MIDASCDLSKGRGSVSDDLTANKWCPVNKLSYCFNSCSLIEFTEGSPSQGRTLWWEAGGGAGVARCSMGTHLVLLLCYPATSLAPLDSNCINGAHRLTGLLRLSADSKSSFDLSAKRNKVVLNWSWSCLLGLSFVLVWTEWRWECGEGSGLHKQTVKSSNWRQLRGKCGFESWVQPGYIQAENKCETGQN